MAEIELFSTGPASNGHEPAAFRRRVRDVARWSEQHGCRGILVYTDNGLVDPWLVSQLVIEATERLAPLVAVQPVYMHPYTVAKMVTSLAFLQGRGVCLNMVAGGFKNDLRVLADGTSHDRRYDRLREYTEIVMRLLAGDAVTRDGEFYQVDHVRLAPPLPAALVPDVFVSGSSPAGLATARALGAITVQYPAPPDGPAPPAAPAGLIAGIRVGIVARDDDGEAWRAARARFPEERSGQLAHELAVRTSDSAWHRDLSRAVDAERAPYWLAPFRNYKTFCPYLVGSYERVGQELAGWIGAGYTRFILDIPVDADDLGHTRRAFDVALARRASAAVVEPVAVGEDVAGRGVAPLDLEERDGHPFVRGGDLHRR